MRAFVAVALVAALAVPTAASAQDDAFVVTVSAVGATVSAKISAGGKVEQAGVAMGKKHDFRFDSSVTKYVFEIAGCGRIQTKTVYVEAGHPGAKITVNANCSLTLGAR